MTQEFFLYLDNPETEDNVEAFRLLVQEDKSCSNTFNQDGFALIHVAAFKLKLKFLDVLLQEGASVDLKSLHESEYTAIQFAVADGQLNVVKLLLDHKANIEQLDQCGNSLLDMAKAFEFEYETLLMSPANIKTESQIHEFQYSLTKCMALIAFLQEKNCPSFKKIENEQLNIQHFANGVKNGVFYSFHMMLESKDGNEPKAVQELSATFIRPG